MDCPTLHIAYLGLGSNVGNRLENINKCIEILSKTSTIEQKSSIYESAPWGNPSQDTFYNMVLKISTANSCEALLTKILEIENYMGRTRTEKWGPRVIDVDILYFDRLILDMEHLTVPHIELPYRRFVLMPLVEIAPAFEHPFFKLTNAELLDECDDNLSVKVIHHVS